MIELVQISPLLKIIHAFHNGSKSFFNGDLYIKTAEACHET